MRTIALALSCLLLVACKTTGADLTHSLCRSVRLTAVMEDGSTQSVPTGKSDPYWTGCMTVHEASRCVAYTVGTGWDFRSIMPSQQKPRRFQVGKWVCRDGVTPPDSREFFDDVLDPYEFPSTPDGAMLVIYSEEMAKKKLAEIPRSE